MLGTNLVKYLPANTENLDSLTVGVSAQTLNTLSDSIRGPYLEAFAVSLATVFLVATVIVFVGFIITLFLPETPLRESMAKAEANVGKDVGEAFAMPAQPDSEFHLLKSLSLLADRDVRRRYIDDIVQRAGLDLSTISAWLLIRLERNPVDLKQLSSSRNIPMDRLEFGIGDLTERGLIEPKAGDIPNWKITDKGCETLNQLVAARRNNLEDFVKDWSPEQRTEIAGMLNRLAKQLVPDAKN
jgi:predicted transcriptional regulator